MNTQAENRDFNTEELAAKFKVKPASILKQHSVTGHYMGIKPVKLPNRKLVWLRADVERVLNGDAK